MDIEALAVEAAEIIENLPWKISREHGHEVAPGFFNLYNEVTGQSKIVLYHPEAGMVFKVGSYCDYSLNGESRRFIGTVTLEGDLVYKIRLPEFHYFDTPTGDTVEVQEYVLGPNCGCRGYECEHSRAIITASGCRDAHSGNWKMVDDEIVLFDFDGIRLADR